MIIRSMSSRGASHGAVAVRLVAFLVAATAMATIPAMLVATQTGHASHQVAFAIVGISALLIVVATALARSLDPLRG